MIQTLVWNDNISLKNIERFTISINQLLKTNTNGIILNIENVLYMNERALGIIANAAQEAKNLNKELVIINNQATIKRIFEIVRFHSIVQVFSHEKKAQQYFKNLFSTARRKVV